MQRIGIFGGTFDPIHQGHLGIALCALDQLRLDRILFVPAARSPFKKGQKPGVSDADRVAMLQLAVQNTPQFQVSAWELEQGGVSYTVDTLKYFKKVYPDSEFFLLMGQDTYEGFERWKNAGEIRRLARIAVAPRAGTGMPGNPEPNVLHLKMPLCDTSSTQLRGSAHQACETGLAGLPEAVQQYIREHALYSKDL